MLQLYPSVYDYISCLDYCKLELLRLLDRSAPTYTYMQEMKRDKIKPVNMLFCQKNLSWGKSLSGI